MTSERDFDRLARDWLDQGPDEAPDRVIAAVLQAAETTPQVRPWLRRPTWRFDIMNRFVLAASTVAILVVVVGGGVLISGSQNQPAAVPVASPSATPTQRPSVSPGGDAGTPLPGELIARWMGSERSVASLDPTAGTSILFGADRLSVSQSNQNGVVNLASDASLAGDATLRLVATATTDPTCSAGDSGTYQWTLSPSGRTLTIDAIQDDCAVRQTVVSGTWWRMGCKDPGDNCLGDLDAGLTYGSQFLVPRLAVGATWTPDFGGLTYTVPEGWANAADWPTEFRLTPSADYALETESGLPDGQFHSIYVQTQPAPTVQKADCSATEIATGEPRTVDGLINWIQGRPAIRSTEPTPVTIDGHDGQMIDIRLKAGQGVRCPDAAGLVADFLAYPDGTGWAWGIQGEERQRLIFLDLGDGEVVMIAIDSTMPDRYDALVAEAMPIIESLTFE